MTKIILDIGFLGHAQDEKSERRGAQRVARKIFDGLVAADQYDVSFVATSHLAGAHDFLQAEKIEADKRLFFHPRQLGLSRTGRKISRAVRRTMEDRSFPARLRRRLMAEVAQWCVRGETRLDSRWLVAVDIYHPP